ncbi:MAG TPA: TatD family hydrolase [Candidatus Dormibacteraeota bacterium]|nr:TatD family hydrolase [Candidatus Dormibacteraeota bacterium]
MDEAVGAGVTRMVAVGVDLERSRRAVALAHGHDEVWAGVGHYPLEPAELDLDALRELASDPRVVVIGEIGLDFEHVGGIAREVQIDRFDQLLTMAKELDLPVSVHNRGADSEVASAIRRHHGLRGVMHYFALDWERAQPFLDLGFYLSFAGLVTRPSRTALREVVKRCPSDRLLLETDSPYGNAQKRMGVSNRPAYLLDTAELVAELRGVTMEQLADLESANAFALFRGMR